MPDWGDDDHPRDENGRFTSGGGLSKWVSKDVAIHNNREHDATKAANAASAKANKSGKKEDHLAAVAAHGLATKAHLKEGNKALADAHGVRALEHVEKAGPIKLTEDHDKYFKQGGSSVPLNKITPARARPDGIARAEALMAHAAGTGGGKRDPISLEHNGDGTYTVKDGNSTFAIAGKQGWSSIRANVWEKGQWKDPGH